MRCMPKQPYMRLVMQRSVGLLNFTANQDSSVMSLGPVFVALPCYSAWICLISSFGSHLFSCPKMREIYSHRSLRGKKIVGRQWSLM